ncbi:MAG: hypothetical protein N3F09_09885 [Bacteroidia bacterium]|nr:hypothetical protein [Bacteroidia bacterium]
MKRLSFLLFKLVGVMMLVSCKNQKKGPEPIIAPPGMHILDLSRYGKPFVIFVPDTTTNKLEVKEQASGELEIKCGKFFHVAILEQAEDLNAKKEELKGDEVNKLKNFLQDSSHVLVWESEITSPQFHFIYNFKIKDSEYSIRDVISTDAEPFTKEQIEKMLESAKNIREAVKPEPQS